MDHLMIHGPQGSSLLLFTTLFIQGTGKVLTHNGIPRLVACVVVFDYNQNNTLHHIAEVSMGYKYEGMKPENHDLVKICRYGE
jgi:hypothetical protein